ncbi:MAG: DUF1588 domain-containing protein [Planctomycetota bacterium]
MAWCLYAPVQTQADAPRAANPVGEEALSEQFRNTLETYCYSCHADGAKKGGFTFDGLSSDLSALGAAEQWQKVYAQVVLGVMPPVNRTQPDPDEAQQVLDTIADKLVENGYGTGMGTRLLHPKYGNVVNHEKLFDGTIQTEPYTPARLWRYRPAIYKQMLPDRFMGSPGVVYAFDGTGYRGEVEIVDQDLILGGKNVKGLKTNQRRGLNQRGAASNSNPFHEFEHHASGFTDYASITADLASLEALMRNAEVIAQTLTKGEIVNLHYKIRTKDSVGARQTGGFAGGITGIISKPFREHDPWFQERWEEGGRYKHRDVFRPYVEQVEPLTDAQVDEAVMVAFKTLLLREPSADEVRRYRGLLESSMPEGRVLAIQGLIVSLCISPEFVYRMELGLGEEMPDGRRRLSNDELYYALHYALTDKDPEPHKAFLIRGNRYPPKLDTREEVYGYVMYKLERLGFRKPDLKAPDWEFFKTNHRIRGFFREYFGYHKAPTVFKDADRFPYHVGSETMVRDTDKLIDWILAEDERVFEKLLTDTRAFPAVWGITNEGEVPSRAHHAHWATYIRAYSDSYTMRQHWEHEQENPGQPVELPKHQRAGILTQPAWLVAYSGNFDNDPIRRGLWIRKHLLGQIVSDVPQDVDAKVPEDPHRTLRDRLEVTREARCWNCHQKMDDLGYAFEMFADSGAFRTEEIGKPVDTRGAITFSGVPELDGPVENAVEMMHRLAESDLARQVFLRYMFRYYMGRNEMLSDSKTLIEMDQAYLESNGSFKHTLATLLSSDSFLYRK